MAEVEYAPMGEREFIVMVDGNAAGVGKANGGKTVLGRLVAREVSPVSRIDGGLTDDSAIRYGCPRWGRVVPQATEETEMQARTVVASGDGYEVQIGVWSFSEDDVEKIVAACSRLNRESYSGVHHRIENLTRYAGIWLYVTGPQKWERGERVTCEATVMSRYENSVIEEALAN